MIFPIFEEFTIFGHFSQFLAIILTKTALLPILRCDYCFNLPIFDDFFSPDIYLLDDPLGALDRKVASKLLKTITESPRLKEKTFIFCSNNAAHLKHADRVIYLDNGRILFDGSYEKFRSRSERASRGGSPLKGDRGSEDEADCIDYDQWVKIFKFRFFPTNSNNSTSKWASYLGLLSLLWPTFDPVVVHPENFSSFSQQL